jgi:hypothetical protein
METSSSFWYIRTVHAPCGPLYQISPFGAQAPSHHVPKRPTVVCIPSRKNVDLGTGRYGVMLQQFASLREHVGCSPDQLSNDSDVTVPIFG